MRLDGYYYTSNLTDRPSPTVTRYFFFSNGKVLFGFNCELDSLQEKESDFDNNFFERQLSPGYNANITNFAIDGSTIQFERVYPMQDYPHAIFSGNIQNDSTFVIRSCKDLRAGTAEKENSIYHFRPFSIPEKYRLIMLARK